MTSGDVKKNNVRLALVAGIIASGILSVLAANQMLNANAQTAGGNAQQPVTSADGQKTANVLGDNSFTNDNRTATVSTSGTASTKVKPDRVSVTVGVETNSTTAQNATSANAETMANVLAALKKLGIADKQISTSNYNLYPVYGSTQPNTDRPCIDIYPPPPGCQPNQQITGYKVTNSATVELDANGNVTAGNVIDAAVKAGANNVNGAYFFLSHDRQQEVRDSLIKDAIANAKHRADTAAGAVGMQVSGVRSIDLSDVQFPVFARNAGTSPEALTEILPGEQEVTTSVSITFYMNGNAGSSNTAGTVGGETEDKSADAVATARQFILSKLPSLGIRINNELDLHSDMVVHVSDKEYHLEYSVLDINKQSHDGHIEIVDGKVTVATLDGKSIL